MVEIYAIDKLPDWWKYRHGSPRMLRRSPSLKAVARVPGEEAIEAALDKSGDRTIEYLRQLH